MRFRLEAMLGVCVIALLFGLGYAVQAQDRDREDAWKGTEQGTEEGMPDAADIPPAIGFDGRPVVPQFRPREWRLGVWATNSKTGCRVTRVVPRGAADRAGIEPGDVILCVNGYQVGELNNQTYYLGEELQKRAGETGTVNILLLDWRRRGLISVDVRLDRESSWDRVR